MIIATCPEATQPSAAMPLSKSGKCNSWNYGILCIHSQTTAELTDHHNLIDSVLSYFCNVKANFV